MHMKCKNPKLCSKKHEKWKKNQRQFIPIGEREHELFLKYLEKKTAKLTLGKHSDKRQYQRPISTNDVNDIIKNGWVIERNFFPNDQSVSLVILGYTRTYRPIHVVCIVLNDDHWFVKTVYSPVSKEYKWANGYQDRICFCKDKEEDE